MRGQKNQIAQLGEKQRKTEEIITSDMTRMKAFSTAVEATEVK